MAMIMIEIVIFVLGFLNNSNIGIAFKAIKKLRGNKRRHDS
jgi:hypothetical protein